MIAPGRGEAVLCTTDSFYEGVDFDLTYFPLKHLGYKAVTAGVSDILAMNALPAQITVSLGVSSKLPVEALQDLYEGIAFACKEQEIDVKGSLSSDGYDDAVEYFGDAVFYTQINWRDLDGTLDYDLKVEITDNYGRVFTADVV